MNEANKKQKLVVIGGPTGSGKTRLGIELAKKYNGELINADARQIYKYLDIGTNKGTVEKLKDELLIKNHDLGDFYLQNPFDDSYTMEINLPRHKINDIEIHLISFLEPSERYDVFRFKKVVDYLIDFIHNKGKLPILVGGTGLYIDAVIRDYNDYANETLGPDREYLNSLDLSILQDMLIKQSSETFEALNNSDRNNPRRLVRLIEKTSDPNWKKTEAKKVEDVYDVKFLYPNYDWSRLVNTINKRALQMFDEGLVEETKNVIEMGFSKNDPGLTGIGYKEVIQYLENEISLEDCKLAVQKAHRQYAKRQRTWFEGLGRGYKLLRVKDINDLKIDMLSLN